MKKLISCIVSIVVLFNVSFASFETFDTDKLVLFKGMIQDLYYEDVPEQVIMEGAIKGMFDALDKYTAYYNADESAILDEALTGNYTGIGIKMESLDDYVHITQVFKNSPAYKAGIETGDYIIEVNGEDIEGWYLNKAASVIRGEEGTEVTLKVLRKDQTFEKKIIREHVQIESCQFDILENNIGYVSIGDFTLDTSKEFTEIMNLFDVLAIKNVILDLRGNAGGYVDQCVEVAEMLVPKGVITTIKYKEGKDEVYTSSLKKTKYKLVVLVDKGTASAAEIVTGAIKDSKVGTIVGTKTYGKGVVQRVLNIIGGGTVKITVGRYYTPNDICIDGIGIEPDVVVEGEEQQLQKAIELFR